MERVSCVFDARFRRLRSSLSAGLTVLPPAWRSPLILLYVAIRAPLGLILANVVARTDVINIFVFPAAGFRFYREYEFAYPVVNPTDSCYSELYPPCWA